ncbi:MAG: SusC/RagA family TonB-linked outer membrane protein, partial [Odoribacter sp.]|nr:SusC/RagA family TonB-linked outer membrane protein [Odoribacter sp.]
MKRNEILCYFDREKMRRFLIRFKFLNLLIVFCLCQLSVSAYAQKKVSLNFSDTPLDKALQQIQQQVDYRFIFNNDDVAKFKVSGSFETTDINEVLDKVLEDKPFNYAIEEEVIIISYKSGYSGVQQNPILIKGIIKDKQGYPLPGASVVINGTSQGVTSNESGEFTIPLNDRNVSLKISFIGMKPIIISVSDKDMLEIVIEEDVQEMSEVVVTGIFQKARESYTGAVTTITEKELKTFGNRNILTTICNIDPSFNILQDNINGSDPNRLPDIQIRGTSSVPTVDNLKDEARANLNQPLFIQDGFEITLQQMMDLNQDEIETIHILKDASATALYGSRGANGVVVIKTKDPEAGRLKITYRGNLNVEIPDLTDYNVLNAREKLDLELQAGIYEGKTAYNQQILDEVYNWKKGEIERGVDTYWLSQPLRTGYGQRHDLRMEGGDNVFRYSASVSYNDVVGVMKGSGRQTFNGGIKLAYYYKDLTFTNYLTIGLNKSENSPYGSYEQYVKMNPYWTPTDENGNTKIYLENFNKASIYSMIQTNPLYNAHLNTFNTSDYTNITNNFAIEWKIRNDLNFRGRLGVTKNLSNTDIFRPKNHTDFAGYIEDDVMRKGSYTYGTAKGMNLDGDATLNYSRNFNDKHQVFAGVNVNIAQNKGDSYTFHVEGFPNEKLDVPSAALQYAKEQTPTGSEYLSRRVGFIGNFNYMFDNRYFLDASYRVDGSSQFGANKWFAPFWATGLGWNVHNEQFFNVDFINQLRFKFSYGISGSQNFSTYQALRKYKYCMGDYYQQWYGAYL